MPRLRETATIGPVRLTISVQDWCLLRTPGFPFSLVGGLTFSDLVTETEKLLDHDQEVTDRCAEFIERRWPELRAQAKRSGGVPGIPFRHLLRAYHAVEKRQELDDIARGALGAYRFDEWSAAWNATVRRRNAAAADVAASYDRAVRRERDEVARLSESAQVRHAIFVSNPEFYRNILAGRSLPARLAVGPPARDLRRAVGTLHRYLRRLASRCETVSFFGPVLFTRLDPDRTTALSVDEPHDPRVVVEASSWVVEWLQRLVDDEVALDDRRIWRNPLFRAVSETVLERTVDGRRVALRPELARLWADADARRVRELGERQGLTGEALHEALRSLGPLVTVATQRLPATELFPLTRLAATHDAARKLARYRDGYADAPWPQRIEWHERAEKLLRGLRLPARQGAGQHYADREIFHEDRTSPYSERVTIGGPALSGLLDAVRSILPISYLAALLTREDAREALRELLDGQPQPLARLATATVSGDGPRQARLRSALTELVRDRATPTGMPVRLTAAEITAAVASCWDLVPPTARYDACLPSPDLMAVGPDLDSATWVLSELHDDCSSIFGGLENPLHSRSDQLWREFAAAVAEVIPPAESATILSRRRTAHVTPELPGCSIELSGLSSKERAETAPIAEVTVPASADGVVVNGEPRRLYPGDLVAPVHRALARPALGPVSVELGEFTPRIVLDRVVYQRARWRIALPEPAGADPFGRWTTGQRWRRSHGLPSQVFVRHPAEPKPLYVDFTDPLAVEDLIRLPPERVVVTEVLPGPDDLWWRVDGSAQCAEFRLGCLVSATPVGSEDDDGDRPGGETDRDRHTGQEGNKAG